MLWGEPANMIGNSRRHVALLGSRQEESDPRSQHVGLIPIVPCKNRGIEPNVREIKNIDSPDQTPAPQQIASRQIASPSKSGYGFGLLTAAACMLPTATEKSARTAP
jgi:hypothetical protein